MSLQHHVYVHIIFGDSGGTEYAGSSSSAFLPLTVLPCHFNKVIATCAKKAMFSVCLSFKYWGNTWWINKSFFAKPNEIRHLMFGLALIAFLVIHVTIIVTKMWSELEYLMIVGNCSTTSYCLSWMYVHLLLKKICDSLALRWICVH